MLARHPGQGEVVRVEGVAVSRPLEPVHGTLYTVLYTVHWNLYTASSQAELYTGLARLYRGDLSLQLEDILEITSTRSTCQCC